MDIDSAHYIVVNMEPTIDVRGSLTSIKDAYLVVQKQVVCKIPRIKEAILILLASFFISSI